MPSPFFLRVTGSLTVFVLALSSLFFLDVVAELWYDARLGRSYFGAFFHHPPPLLISWLLRFAAPPPFPLIHAGLLSLWYWELSREVASPPQHVVWHAFGCGASAILLVLTLHLCRFLLLDGERPVSLGRWATHLFLTVALGAIVVHASKRGRIKEAPPSPERDTP